MNTEDKRMRTLFLLPTIVVLAIVAIYPLIYTARLSFQDWNLLRSPTPEGFIGFENYSFLLTHSRTWNALRVSGFFTAVSVGVSFLFGLGLALLFSQKHMARAGAIRTALIIPIVITPVVAGVVWRMMLAPGHGVINYFLRLLGFPDRGWLGESPGALYALTFVDVWEWTPFMMLVIFAGLMSIPEEITEAAKVEGASPFQTLWLIILPYIKPVILVALIIRSVDAFRWFDTFFVMTRGGPGITTENLSIYIFQLAFMDFNVSQGAALAIIMLIVTLVFATAFVKALRRNI